MQGGYLGTHEHGLPDDSFWDGFTMWDLGPGIPPGDAKGSTDVPSGNQSGCPPARPHERAAGYPHQPAQIHPLYLAELHRHRNAASYQAGIAAGHPSSFKAANTISRRSALATLIVPGHTETRTFQAITYNSTRLLIHITTPRSILPLSEPVNTTTHHQLTRNSLSSISTDTPGSIPAMQAPTQIGPLPIRPILNDTSKVLYKSTPASHPANPFPATPLSHGPPHPKLQSRLFLPRTRATSKNLVLVTTTSHTMTWRRWETSPHEG
ncbi:hypothetical protein QBC34DRAFT_107461 [Podospora aff. communis PSN243]|uniref:Uncharacterized protein n=1 Tax=Podospora aff. communis PSN243 TaxID=3040156 RepID=A0AAV9H308_9PEZI|nr:hypothetical protein QBC34DRAFT_107461 [Podospora aff. communis PSN243]